MTDPPEPDDTGDPPAARWIVVSGETVAVGDEVTVDLGEPVLAVVCDVAGALPLVRIQEGDAADEVLPMTPGQIMGLAHDGRRPGGRPHPHR